MTAADGLRVGDVAALGLRGGLAPLGVVVALTDTEIRLHPLQGTGALIVPRESVQEVCLAPATAEVDEATPAPGCDVAPLRAFQLAWGSS